MCAYSNMGDHVFRYDPPWHVPPSTPYIPQPVNPMEIKEWDLQRLREYRDLLKEIRDLEAQAAKDCEPNKADYVGLFTQRINDLSGSAST